MPTQTTGTGFRIDVQEMARLVGRSENWVRNHCDPDHENPLPCIREEGKELKFWSDDVPMYQDRSDNPLPRKMSKRSVGGRVEDLEKDLNHYVKSLTNRLDALSLRLTETEGRLTEREEDISELRATVYALQNRAPF